MRVARVAIERLARRSGALLRAMDVLDARRRRPMLRARATAGRSRPSVAPIPIRHMSRGRRTRAPARARRRRGRRSRRRDRDMHRRRPPRRPAKQQRRRRHRAPIHHLLQVLRQLRTVRPLPRMPAHTHTPALPLPWRRRARLPLAITVDAHEVQQTLDAALMLQRRVLRRRRAGALTAATTAKKPRLRPAAVARRARRDEARRARALALRVPLTIAVAITGGGLVAFPERDLCGARARAFPACHAPLLAHGADARQERCLARGRGRVPASFG